MKKIIFITIFFAASYCSAQQRLKTKSADSLRPVLSWEGSELQFYNADIKTLMGAIAVLYKVDIVYVGVPSVKKICGDFDMHGKVVSKFLDILNEMGFHCKLKNGKVWVYP